MPLTDLRNPDREIEMLNEISASANLTRADVLKRAAALGFSGSVLAALYGRIQQAEAAVGAENTITMSSFGGAFTNAWRTAIAEPFTKATGIRVRFDDAPGQQIAKLTAQRSARHVSWDVIDGQGYDYIYLAKKGWLTPLPADLRARLLKISYPGTVKRYGVASGGGANQVIVCNRDAVSKVPITPRDFFDSKKFPGRRGMWKDGYFDNVFSALLADGVHPNKIWPLDLNRAYKKLDTIKSSIDVWWTSGDQQQQIMRDNEVDFEFAWDGRAFRLKNEGTLDLNISYVGAQVAWGFDSVPKGAPNVDGALKFLEFYATHAAAQAKWTIGTGYTGSNTHAAQHLTRAHRKQLWTYAPNRKVAITLDVDKLARYVNLDVLKKRWYDWLQG